jgi:hypothetical protein
MVMDSIDLVSALEDDDFFLVKSLDLEDEEGLNFEDLIA